MYSTFQDHWNLLYFSNKEIKMLRFIDMKVFHIHRVNGGENICRALHDTFSSFWQNNGCTGSKENKLISITNRNER